MKQYLQSGKVSLFIMLLCLAIFIIDSVLPIQLNQFGIVPRRSDYLWGIFISPFLHGSWGHLASNFLPFIILGTLIGRELISRFWVVFLLSIIGSGALVWLFARGNSVHIGMSGVIYAFWGYLIVYGVMTRKLMALFISIITVIFYGGLLFGVLPTKAGVSFESHLLGAIVGALLGFYFAKRDRLR